MYRLESFEAGQDEFLVFGMNEESPVGTIRHLGGGMWGWIDRLGRHEFSSKSAAAIACVRGASIRQARQRQRAREAKVA